MVTQRSVIGAAGHEFRAKNISQRAQKIVLSPIKEMSILADQLQEETGFDIVSFGQGIPYLDTPEYIKEGIREALKDPSTARYTLEPGMTELRELIARDLEQFKNISRVEAKREVMISSGCQEAMACALGTVLDEGDEIIILEPAFPSHIEQVIQFGGIPIFVSLDEKEGWRLNMRVLQEKLSKKTKAILFSHPSNPTGTVFTRKELRGLADVAKEKDLVIISDETYDFLVYDNTEFVSPISFPDIRDRVILCGSFSKKYSLTGYRVGYAFSDAGIIDHMLKAHDALAICAPAISQKAAIAALRGDGSWAREAKEKLQANRELMCRKLDEMSDLFSYQRPQGSYYILAEYNMRGMDSFAWVLRMLREARVITIPGSAFGPSGEGHVRFSFACSPEEIEEGFLRLGQWSRELQAAERRNG